MGNSYIEAAKTVSSITGFVSDEESAIMNLSDPKNRLILVSGGASATKVGVGMLEMGGKKVPFLGGILSFTTLTCTSKTIYDDYKNPHKNIKTNDILSAASDIAGIVSMIALCVAGAFAAAFTAPVLAGIAIFAGGLSLISAGLTLITLHPSLQDHTIKNDIDKLTKFFDLHKSPRSFENAKYIDLDAFHKLPGSSIEYIMELQKGNIITFPNRSTLPFKPIKGSHHSHHRNSRTHKRKTLHIDNR